MLCTFVLACLEYWAMLVVVTCFMGGVFLKLIPMGFWTKYTLLLFSEICQLDRLTIFKLNGAEYFCVYTLQFLFHCVFAVIAFLGVTRSLIFLLSVTFFFLVTLLKTKANDYHNNNKKKVLPHL